jgi:hypothetical protein
MFTVADRMGTAVGVWLVARSGQSVESLMVTKYDSPAEAQVARRKDPPKAGYRSFTWGSFLVWAKDCPFYGRVRAELSAD